MRVLSSLLVLLRRLRYLALRDRYTAQLEEEVRLHVELRAAALQRRGMGAGAARIAARRRFGNSTLIQERSRDMWGFSLIEHAMLDVRFALRRLRLRPGFAFATIAVAALGIGATTGVFSAIDAAILRPLPFPHPEQLFVLPEAGIPFDDAGQFPQDRRFFDVTDAASMTDVFAGAAGYAAGGLNLDDARAPRRLRIGVVTTDFFKTVGVAPELGRTFDAEEGRPHGPHSVVLSDALWRAAFGARPMVGTPIRLNGASYTVVGIMPDGFTFPNQSDAWIPLTVPTTFETFAPFRGFLPSSVIARTAPGVTRTVASSRTIAKWVQVAGPGDPARRSNLDEVIADLKAKGAVRPLQEILVGDNRRALMILLGATALLLLIASANVANLLVSDAALRRREMALREVLGASRSRLSRQLLTECLLLSLAGAGLGVALSPLLLRVLSAMMPASLVGLAPPRLDPRVLAFATLLAIATGIIFGMWPTLRASRGDANETLKQGGTGATAGGLGRLRRTLVTVEIALTVMLLIGAGLMMRSLERVLSLDSGIHAENVGTLEISFGQDRTRADRVANTQAILDRLLHDGRVSAAGVVNDLPLRGGGGISLAVDPEGRPKQRGKDRPLARNLVATAGYFKALGIPLVRGSLLPDVVDSLSPHVAVINVAMAKAYWPDADPIGKRFFAPFDTFTVVGIVADVRESRLESDVRPQMYSPFGLRALSNLAIVARSDLPANELLALMQDAVRAADPSQASYNVRSMEAVVAASIAPRRTNTVLVTLFGAVATLLSAFGVYAVVSYGVTRRSREFGIRAALGASGRNIAALVGREMAATTLIGIAIGLAGAWALARLMSSLLYEVQPHDATTFIVAPVLLAVPAILATLIPARRAMQVSPTEVMRAE